MANEVYKAARKGGAADEFLFALQANEVKDLLVAQNLPPGTEATRQGKRWSMMSVAAIAGLVVRPSTTAALEIYNGYSEKSLIVDRLFYFNLVSTNVVEGFSGWAMVTLAKAAPTAEATALVKSANGGTYGGSVIGDFSTTVVDNGWYPWTNAYQKGAGGVVPFGAVIGEVGGRLIVPPGSSLCLHVVSSLVGQTFTMGAEWIEEILTNE